MSSNAPPAIASKNWASSYCIWANRIVLLSIWPNKPPKINTNTPSKYKNIANTLITQVWIWQFQRVSTNTFVCVCFVSLDAWKCQLVNHWTSTKQHCRMLYNNAYKVPISMHTKPTKVCERWFQICYLCLESINHQPHLRVWTVHGYRHDSQSVNKTIVNVR